MKRSAAARNSVRDWCSRHDSLAVFVAGQNFPRSRLTFRVARAPAIFSMSIRMNRIVHISLKVDDVRKTGDFYRDVFGFKDAETRKTRDHLSRHMSDGNIDFTMMAYDEGTQSAESRAAGDGPCIHHFAIEVDDIAASTDEIRKWGCEIVSDPGVTHFDLPAVLSLAI